MNEEINPIDYALYFFLLGGAYGLIYAKDFLEIFLYFEWCLICSYFLLFEKKREKLLVLLKYFILSTIGSSLLLLGISMLSIPAPHIIILLIIFIGLAVKMGIVPFHMWVPEVYSTAKLSVVIIFSAILSKIGGLALFKFYNLFTEYGLVLTIIALVSMTLANISALVQKNIKTLLAYSSIAQLSIILFGFSLGSTQALTGSLYHIISHGFTVTLAFITVFILIKESNNTTIKGLKGIARTNPYISAGLLISFLSMSSIPGLALFVSEALILLGSNNLLFSLIMIMNLVISSVYYINTLYILFKKKRRIEDIELSLNQKIVITLLIISIILFGLFPNSLILLVQNILPLFF